MKRNNLQEDAIGTAAVDLFASGMGAFILIAILFMVLFAASSRFERASEAPVEVAAAPECPKPEPEELTCPPAVACPAVVDVPKPQVCPEPVVANVCPAPAPMAIQACPDPAPVPDCPICPTPVGRIAAKSVEMVAAPPVEPVVAIPLSPPGCTQGGCTNILPEFDLVFLVDSTSSMNFEIESLKRNLYVLVEVLEKIMPSVAIGIVTFNDRQQRPVLRHHPLRRLTGDADALVDLQRFMRDIAAGTGKGENPDRPEAILSALEVAVSSPFREGVRNRAIIIITDAYAYEEEMEKTFAIARAFSNTDGQRVSAVQLQSDRTSEVYLDKLAKAGNGRLVVDRGSILANVLLTIL